MIYLYSFRSFGFAGSRSGFGAGAAALIAASVAISGGDIFATCGRGVPAAALAAAGPSGHRFPVSAVAVSVPHRARFAVRAASFCRALASAPAPVLLAWPASPAPLSLRSGRRLWQSAGSGTWSEVALCAGLGVPVAVFAPAAFLPAWAGWSAGTGELSGSFIWSPSVSLF